MDHTDALDAYEEIRHKLDDHGGEDCVDCPEHVDECDGCHAKLWERCYADCPVTFPERV